MELKQFIKEALLSITNGVDEANKDNNRFKIIGVKHDKSGMDGSLVDFDVSIVANEKSGSAVDGKAGISLLSVISVRAGVESKTDQSSAYQNTQRLNFKIYISEN